MAKRSSESGIPRTYGGSLRLVGQGADAAARGTIGFAFSLGKTVGLVSGAGVRAVGRGCTKAKARRAELAAARQATAEVANGVAKHSNAPVVIGAIAGLAMVGAGVALLKYRSAKTESSDFDEFDDDAQLDDATA
ncbi:hypothetical protein [Smaragdicoccus niigatensis]|uniref:hypothetical protein n=1 Tax=Smaragdicoccus niigatensis TaxID=359359 RepID=UPI0003650EB7|nr:hypothetical protein [Smaragdicoccus niigatensis]